MSCHERRNNLRFYGFPEEEGVETDNQCELKINQFLIRNLGFTHDVCIERCHRLGRKNNGKFPRAIIVKFTYHKDRQKIWRNKQLLAGLTGADKNIFIREDFPIEIEQRINVLYPIFRAAKGTKDMKATMSVDKLYIDGKMYTTENLKTLPEALQPENLATKYNDDTCWFWRKESFLSNFHPSPFSEGGHDFNCVEQYFTASRAKMFNDQEALAKILKTKDPSVMKQTSVKGYNDREWKSIAKDIMKRGVELKFEQNPTLLDKLKKTGNRTICEASPTDKFWGVGMSMHNKDILDRSKWGENHLGKILMEVRQKLS